MKALFCGAGARMGVFALGRAGQGRRRRLEEVTLTGHETRRAIIAGTQPTFG